MWAESWRQEDSVPRTKLRGFLQRIGCTIAVVIALVFGVANLLLAFGELFSSDVSPGKGVGAFVLALAPLAVGLAVWKLTGRSKDVVPRRHLQDVVVVAYSEFLAFWGLVSLTGPWALY